MPTKHGFISEENSHIENKSTSPNMKGASNGIHDIISASKLWEFPGSWYSWRNPFSSSTCSESQKNQLELIEHVIYGRDFKSFSNPMRVNLSCFPLLYNLIIHIQNSLKIILWLSFGYTGENPVILWTCSLREGDVCVCPELNPGASQKLGIYFLIKL